VLLTRGRFRPFTLLHNDMLVGAATQFFCDPPAQGNPLVSADDGFADVTRDTYDDECVYRDDTMVLLELTTRDMMEVGHLRLANTRGHGLLATAPCGGAGASGQCTAAHVLPK
jgi:hypothetical protein